MNPQVLQNAFSGTVFHPNYEETVEIAEALEVHAEGDYPDDMMDERRPNESEQVKEYRKKIFRPVTQPYVNKVFTSLNKIRRSSEWAIMYDAKAVPPRITEGNTLEDYLTYYFPTFGSITTWAFDVLLRQLLVDPNSYVVIMPFDEVTAPNDYVNPFPYLFESESIIAVEPDGVVVLSEEKSVYRVGDVEKYGDIYIVITDMTIEKWHQASDDRRFTRKYVYEHNIGMVPAFKVKSVVKCMHGKDIINSSRLSPMLPELDEAIREYSDLQAEVVQHIYSEKWEYANADSECRSCTGQGWIKTAGLHSEKIKCESCKGTGVEPRGPYTTLYVKAAMQGDTQAMPTPPLGYVQKQTQIVELQDKRIDKHIYKALAAVNMEFLAEKPLAESGISKAYDADETNNFVHSVAEDLVATLDQTIYFINEMRYLVVMPEANKRAAMLPTVTVPERFDLFSAQVIEQQLSSARTSKVSPVIINAMEQEYANKMFSSNPDVGKQVALIIKLDPLAGISEEDKMVIKSNKGITDLTYIVSSNIKEFIDRAIDEKGDSFYDMPTKDQRALMRTYAQEQIDQSSAAANILAGGDAANAALATGGNSLKESVGGLTGMIEIAKAVASGLYDLDAAVALVSDRFGLTEEQARKQLGTPQIANSQVDTVVQLT